MQGCGCIESKKLMFKHNSVDFFDIYSVSAYSSGTGGGGGEQ